jgi:hypothetical protein
MKWMALLIFGGLGLAAIIGGLIWGVRRYALLHSGVRTQGKVVENYKGISIESTGRNPGVIESYYPVVEYRTTQGEAFRFRGSTGSGVPEFEVGTPVELVYNPKNPAEAQLVNFSQFWLGPVVVIAVGLVCFLMGTGSFFLIGGSDRSSTLTLRDMHRQSLAARPDAVRIDARIQDLRQKAGSKYVLVCVGLRPGANAEEEFESDFFSFNPGIELVGRPVTIYLDPFDRQSYFVEFGPLLKEIIATQSR